jgi:DNA polymerase-3 subunit delta'
MAKRTTKAGSVLAAAEPPAAAGPVYPVTTLDAVFGQRTAKQTLESAMQAGRVHHAWIFHGPAGVGKFTTAIAFAAAILDPTTSAGLSGQLAPEADSAVQRMVRAGSHPDLHVIRKELAAVSSDAQIRTRKQTNIPVDVLDEFLLAPAAKTRVLRGDSLVGKVFIIDEAELVDPRGQNALLKTLEEPPEGTVIILVTTFPDELLATIRSRCQRVGFVPLAEEDMRQWFAVSGLEVPGEQKDWLLRFAAGSPGAATLAAKCNLFSWHETLTPMLEAASRGEYALELGEAMAKLVDEQAAAVAAADKLASKDGANKVWGRRMLAFVGEHARAKLRARASSSKATPEVLEGDAAAQRALRAIEAVNRAEEHLERNVRLSTVFDNLAVQIVAEPVRV